MNAAEILAQHQWYEGGGHYCKCGNDIGTDDDLGEHQLVMLNAFGYAVLTIPASDSQSLADVIQKHRLYPFSVTGSYRVACFCGWTKDITNTHKSGIRLHSEHIEDVWRES